MADNYPVGSIVMAPGTTMADTHQDAICKAFKVAMEKFCADEQQRIRKVKNQGKQAWEDEKAKLGSANYPPKSFDDQFYDALAADTSPAGQAANAALEGGREAAAVVTASGPQTLQALSAAETAAADAATAAGLPIPPAPATAALGQIASVVATGASYVAVRAQSLGIVSNLFPGLKQRFLDGRFSDGQVLELKGPKDKFHAGQESDLGKMSNGKGLALASCKTCNAPCKEGNKCP